MQGTGQSDCTIPDISGASKYLGKTSTESVLKRQSIKYKFKEVRAPDHGGHRLQLPGGVERCEGGGEAGQDKLLVTSGVTPVLRGGVVDTPPVSREVTNTTFAFVCAKPPLTDPGRRAESD